ncbi:flagellar hook protein FlgE [Fervidibacillus halotolerans]|uniref:Flagellar hook protein FlgE n=1 Tax=Fervidibacillus halotolerans TaxID=2980027 RepID=A0A9E8M157_9BACI|nr:flagellar hook protein FlgE [Fervidibacillus halotolerans]WAA13598.1 flagellar hook protein FlgE [Fervidibacillus halotolerans]
MLRSMYSGISGLKSFQTKLDVIGNNIANVNTYGFKKGRVTFKDAMSQTISGAVAAQGNRGGMNPKQVGLGTEIATIDSIHTEASMQSTGRSLDLAINGDGYFVFKDGDQYLFSRAGNLYLDEFGTMVNADGYKVQAFDMDGNLGDVIVNVNATLPAVATQSIGISGNLSSNAVDGFVYSQQFEVVDSNGKTNRIDIYFEKANGNEWTVYFTNPDTFDSTTDPHMVIQYDGNGNITQVISMTDNGSGTLTSSTNTFNPGDSVSVTQAITVDGNNVNYSLNLDQLTFQQGSNDATILPDGNTEGQLLSFNIGPTGEINGIYSNGLIATLGYLAVAKFSNPSGLQSVGGNLFQSSVNSGAANIGYAGDGRGSILSERLEMSNVDLSEEFTEMIVAQRGFQANTRIITTSDEILQELVNLKR